ncbi:MAG: helix-turn-helix domain-containing protein [Phycisphaerales bacterium]|nr:helix-turn-helix domain-containing protein [Phycisphaerales bacterium]
MIRRQPQPTPAARPIGELIRAQRCALDRSLQQVARAAGCSRSYLCQIENARVAPPAEALLARLERALQLAPGDLAGPARAQRSARRGDSIAGAALREDLARLESALARLTGWLTDTPPAEGITPGDCPRIPVVSGGDPAEAAPDLTGPGLRAGAGGEFICVPGLHDPEAFALRLKDDRMEPLYRAGDLVVFSPARPALSGADCFVRMGPGLGDQARSAGVFARVYFDGAGPVRLHPLNSAHPPRLVPRKKIAGLHPAITVIRSIK